MNRRNFLKMLGCATVAVLVGCKKDEDGKVDPLIKPAAADLDYLIIDDFDGPPEVGVRTMVDWDAGEDVSGSKLTIDNGTISWQGKTPTRYYTDGDWLIAREGGWNAYFPLFEGDRVGLIFSCGRDGVHFIIDSYNYSTQVVYANGSFNVRRRIMHTPKVSRNA